MDEIDLQLHFLEGKPIPLSPNLLVHKVPFSIVSKIGYTKYNRMINTLCLTKQQVSTFVTNGDIDVYDFITYSAYSSIIKKTNEEETFMEELLLVFKYIFNEDVVYSDEYNCFVVGDNGFLFRNNFEEFQSIIKKRNCLETIQEDKEDPANERAKLLLEKRRKAREKVAQVKSKQNEDDSLTIVDLISIFAESEHIFIEDVFKYDIYQFNNQFNRMKIFKDYEVNVQALLAGAKSEDINLQHWLSRIKKE